MLPETREYLTKIAENRISPADPSHDFQHAVRVLGNVEHIAGREGGDLEVLVPGALFHDVIVYPKDSPKSADSQSDSARLAEGILLDTPGYPRSKIEAVAYAIKVCSFTKGIMPDTLEAKILQDSDGLEATGAIAIMRTFSSTGAMGRPFYNTEDPFCNQRVPDSRGSAIDLFYSRLLRICSRMHTRTAKQMAEQRTQFLEDFLRQLKSEIKR